VPLRRSNVDTDQIIPAEYLKRITRSGFEDGLFAAWRADPSFVLNDNRYAGATVLLAGPDFGTGSSREHAVWALQDYGFRAVVAPRFGDIFRGNATKAGLLPVVLAEADVVALQDLVESDPATEVTVDLEACEVRAGSVVATFLRASILSPRIISGLLESTGALTVSFSETVKAIQRGSLPGSNPRFSLGWVMFVDSERLHAEKNAEKAIESANGINRLNTNCSFHL